MRYVFLKNLTKNRGPLMKINKNIIAFAVCLAMVYPVKCEETTEETNRLTNQQETLISEIATAAAQGAISAVENAIEAAQAQNSISLEQAHEILQKLIDSLVDGSTFEINDIKYVVEQAHRSLESAATDYQTISQEDALTLLQKYNNNLESEESFSFNLKFKLNETLHTLTAIHNTNAITDAITNDNSDSQN